MLFCIYLVVIYIYIFFNFYSDFTNIIHNKKHKFILNKHKSQLKFLYKNATLCIFIRTLPPTQNELIERKTIACVWELRHFFFFFFWKQFVQKPSIFHRTFSSFLVLSLADFNILTALVLASLPLMVDDKERPWFTKK